MRLGTKILLLTLTVTLSLSALVMWVVSREITASAMTQARIETAREFNGYFNELAAIHQSIIRPVQLLLEDSATRADLEIETYTDALRPPARAQFEQYVFPTEMQKELRISGMEPAFHVLVGPKGQVLAATSVDDEHLAQQLREKETVDWRWRDVLAVERPARQYALIDKRLYLTFAVPLRLQMAELPEFVYFVGFRIDERWMRARLAPLSQFSTSPLRAWFVVNGSVVAGNPPTGWETILALRTAAPGEWREPVEFTAQHERFIGERWAFTPAANTAAMLCIASSLDAELKPRLHALYRGIGLATAAVVALAIVSARWLARLVARPIEDLDAAAQRVERGDFSRPVVVNRRDELGDLARSFNDMAAGLMQRDLIKDTFGKFVSPRIVEQFISDPSRLRLGGEKRVQSVLFADLADFTATAERMPPDELLRMLNDYLQTTSDAVERQRGIVDKFVGDGVVAFFGPPVEPNHAVAACRAAIEIAHTPGQRPVRVGIASGEVLVGNVGSRSKFNYTVIGDVANLASRLQAANKLYGTSILVTSTTVTHVRGEIVTRWIDTVRVPGRVESVQLHEVLGESGTSDGALACRREAYHEALALYHARQWSLARDAFQAIDDKPAQIMAIRCAVLVERGVAGDWDGVWNLEVK